MLPVGKSLSSCSVFLVSHRLDPVQPIGWITISGLGSNVVSQVVPHEFIISRNLDKH